MGNEGIVNKWEREERGPANSDSLLGSKFVGEMVWIKRIRWTENQQGNRKNVKKINCKLIESQGHTVTYFVKNVICL